MRRSEPEEEEENEEETQGTRGARREGDDDSLPYPQVTPFYSVMPQPRLICIIPIMESGVGVRRWMLRSDIDEL